MSTFDAAALRARPHQFRRALRGYRPSEVHAWFGRLALAAEAVGPNRETATAIELPLWAQPDAVCQHHFTVEWRGYSRAEVDAYCQEVAEDLRRLLQTR